MDIQAHNSDVFLVGSQKTVHKAKFSSTVGSCCPMTFISSVTIEAAVFCNTTTPLKMCFRGRNRKESSSEKSLPRRWTEELSERNEPTVDASPN